MSQWYPIVYSRTYETDFRMIAIPKFIRDEDKQSILDYILGTTRQPEELIGKPRFSLFKSKNFCVVGITCVGYELIANYPDGRYSDKTRDLGNRPIYGFFGYVAKLDDSQELAIPTSLKMMKLETFQNLYEYIAQNWGSREYGDSIDSESQGIDNPFGELLSQEEIENNDLENFNLNRNPAKIHVWTDRDREKIWSVAAKNIKKDYPVSLCLDVPSPRDALASCFLNATALIEEKKELVREPSKPNTPAKETIVSLPINSSNDNSIPEYYQPINPNKEESFPQPAWEEVLALVAGGAIGLLLPLPIPVLGGTIIRLSLGAGCGWVASGWLTDKGISGAIARQTSEALGFSGKSSSNKKKSNYRSDGSNINLEDSSTEIDIDPESLSEFKISIKKNSSNDSEDSGSSKGSNKKNWF